MLCRATRRSAQLRASCGSSRAHFHISAREAGVSHRMLASVDVGLPGGDGEAAHPKLTRALIAAVEKLAPPRSGLSRPAGYATKEEASADRSGHAPRERSCRRVTAASLEADSGKVFRLEGTPLRNRIQERQEPFRD